MTPNSEPVGWAGAITAFAIAVIPFLRAFNVSISEQQGDALMGLLAAAILVGTVFVRSRVTPVKNAEAKIDEAFKATAGQPKPTL